VDDGRIFYQVNVVHKEGVNISTPAIPASTLWEKNADFQKILLAKRSYYEFSKQITI